MLHWTCSRRSSTYTT